MLRLNNLGTLLVPTGFATARLQAEGLRRYGARALAVQGIVYVAAEDWVETSATLRDEASVGEATLSFYLGGEGNTVLVPGWTLEPKTVRAARARAARRRVGRLFDGFDEFLDHDVWRLQLREGWPMIRVPRRLARWLVRASFAQSWHWLVTFREKGIEQ